VKSEVPVLVREQARVASPVSLNQVLLRTSTAELAASSRARALATEAAGDS